MPKDDEDTVEVRCPECSAKVSVPREKAERDFKATCPNGHEVPLVKAL
ncbi:MAG: hypothetical protein KF850_14050 [Labilithrix sp.]|nr:hypothetical protein [Labilithrix sp.]